MRAFEEHVAAELALLVRAGVPARGIRLAVRELVVVRLERGPVGAGQVREAAEAAARAACRLVRQLDVPADLVDVVCAAAVEAVRGHGGESARWLADATGAVEAVLHELTAAGTPRPSRLDPEDAA
jgi:hypothetical protein